MEKTCIECEITKPFSDFGRERPYRRMAIGDLAAECFYEVCKPCTTKLSKKRWYEENREEVIKTSTAWTEANRERANEHRRNYARKKRWAERGMTEERFEELLGQCGGRCPGCTLLFTPGRPPCVDHAHDTGVNRGLLCHACNLALGYAKDAPETLRRLADYLNRHLVSAPSDADLTSMTAAMATSGAVHG